MYQADETAAERQQKIPLTDGIVPKACEFESQPEFSLLTEKTMSLQRRTATHARPLILYENRSAALAAVFNIQNEVLAFIAV